jgi:hypothetical protein
MLLRFLNTLGVYQDVINDYYDEFIQFWQEHGIHWVHEMCMSIGESK